MCREKEQRIKKGVDRLLIKSDAHLWRKSGTEEGLEWSK
jgi:hypothetical protein